MSSKLEIINFALDRLAVAPLSNLTTVSEVVELCNRTYEQARVFLLRSHRWNFSIKRVTGVTEVKPNTVRYTYSDGIGRLSIHSDQFKPLRVLECDRDYTVEGNEIVFEGSGDIKIKYVDNVTDSDTFDSGFTTLLSVYIAYLMSERLTQSTSKMKMLEQEYLMTDYRTRLINHVESNEVIQVIRS
jgi:hypothetical protein